MILLVAKYHRGLSTRGQAQGPAPPFYGTRSLSRSCLSGIADFEHFDLDFAHSRAHFDAFACFQIRHTHDGPQRIGEMGGGQAVLVVGLSAGRRTAVKFISVIAGVTDLYL